MWNSLYEQRKAVELRCSNYEMTNRNAMVVAALSAYSWTQMIYVANFRHDVSAHQVPASVAGTSAG